LRRFIASGGVVVVCDFSITSLDIGGTWEILDGADLMEITGAASVFDETVTIVNGDDPLTSGLSTSYTAMMGSSSYDTTEDDVLVAAASGQPVVLHKVVTRTRADVYALPYDFFSWDDTAADVLYRAVSYGFGAEPIVGAVRQCVDTTDAVDPGNPAPPVDAGEFGSTVAALEHAGLPEANIIELADAADAAARLGEYDVLLFMEPELCDLESDAWRDVIRNLIEMRGRVVVTHGGNASFIDGLGLFGSGTAGDECSDFAAVESSFWGEMPHPGALEERLCWRWDGPGLDVLGHDVDDETHLSVWGYTVE
jgi:hypothetical protein